jgi:hypothetical protein
MRKFFGRYCSVFDVSSRYRGRRFWEHAQIGAGPTDHLERARETGPTANPPPRHTLRGPRPEIDWNVDWRRGGGLQGGAVAGFLTKNLQKVSQNVILRCLGRSSKRLGRRFCRNRYLKKLSYLISYRAI